MLNLSHADVAQSVVHLIRNQKVASSNLAISSISNLNKHISTTDTIVIGSMLILSIIVISIVGTVAHFIYELSDHNKIVGLFGAVNESTWEHIKIALTATILWSLVDGFMYGANPNYFLAKLLSLLMIIFLMPVLFYGYQFLFKKDNTFINILIFYIVIICSQLLFYHFLKLNPVNFFGQYLSCIGTFIVFGAYMTLTLMPLRNFLFQDPITNQYGYQAHSDKPKTSTPTPTK